MKKGKTAFVSFLIIILTVLACIFANVLNKKNAGMGGMGKFGKGGMNVNSTVSVKTQKLEITTLHGYVLTNGEIESQNSVSVFPDISGKIIQTNVMLGSTVKKGEILGYIDPSTPGSYFKQSPIYAPISGSVISTPLKNGTTVSTNTAICIIGDIRNLQVLANVPERYVSVLKVGLKAQIFVEAYPDVYFVATVKGVSPVLDATNRTKQIILQFDEKDERINAGMFSRVKLFTEDYENAVVMPLDSVVQNGDDFFTYVVNDDSTVSKRKIQLGKTVDGIVQILSGVKSGEKIVVQGQTSLGDGSKVQDISNAEKSSEKGDRK